MVIKYSPFSFFLNEMKYFAFFLSLVLFGVCHLDGCSQNVSLICYGEGSTHEEAIRNAIRNALEQTYGTLVSSNTKIVNDELMSDEIASMS